LLEASPILTGDGYEYQQNAGAWTSLTTGTTFDFTGVTTFIVRKAATGAAFHSDASTDLDT
jgi:predicted AlkP superfamily phosphohydrolase/phosphomutase